MRLVSRLILCGLMASSLVRAQQAPTAPSQPAVLTADEDHKRIMDLLKISGFPPGANPSSPDTYNEALASPYPTLPDPLTMKNGQKVTTAAMWRTRRTELIDVFEREIYGRRPANIPKVSWQVVNTSHETNGSVATVTRQLLGRVDNSAYPAISVNIQAILTLPASVRERVPVIIQFGGGTFDLPANVSTSANPCQLPGAGRGAPPPAPPAASGAPQELTWQQQILSRGWGYVNLNVGSVQGDCGAGLQAGIIGLVNKGQPRAPDDWGSLRAWAWGASRLLDQLETNPEVDSKRAVIEGVSRFGKAALVTMAYEPRYAVGFIGSSGAGGAALARRNWGERLENVAGSGEYHWMAGNYIRYAADPLGPDDLPVDAHELIALAAPRPLFIGAGTLEQGDGWVDPKGMFLAAKAASPVYRLLGKRGIDVPVWPPVGTPLTSGELAYRQHAGGHTSGPNWATFLDFAARYFERQ